MTQPDYAEANHKYECRRAVSNAADQHGIHDASLETATTDGVPFAEALSLVTVMSDSGGKLEDAMFMYRRVWNGNGLRIYVQWPDAGSANTVPYTFTKYPNDAKTTPGLRAPWVPSMTDMFASDWFVGNDNAERLEVNNAIHAILRAVQYVDLKNSQGACEAAVLRLLRGRVSHALVEIAVDTLRQQYRSKHYPNHVWVDKIIFHTDEMDRLIRNKLLEHGFDVDYANALVGKLVSCVELTEAEKHPSVTELIELRAAGILDGVLVYETIEATRQQRVADAKSSFHARSIEDAEATIDAANAAEIASP